MSKQYHQQHSSPSSVFRFYKRRSVSHVTADDQPSCDGIEMHIQDKLLVQGW